MNSPSQGPQIPGDFSFDNWKPSFLRLSNPAALKQRVYNLEDDEKGQVFLFTKNLIYQITIGHN